MEADFVNFVNFVKHDGFLVVHAVQIYSGITKMVECSVRRFMHTGFRIHLFIFLQDCFINVPPQSSE